MECQEAARVGVPHANELLLRLGLARAGAKMARLATTFVLLSLVWLRQKPNLFAVSAPEGDQVVSSATEREESPFSARRGCRMLIYLNLQVFATANAGRVLTQAQAPVRPARISPHMPFSRSALCVSWYSEVSLSLQDLHIPYIHMLYGRKTTRPGKVNKHF